jgi:hypothetical protein
MRSGNGFERSNKTLRTLILIIFAAEEQHGSGDVLFANDWDRRMNTFPQLASAALVAAFLAAMLVSASLFTEYRSMKLSTAGVVQVKGLPL